MQTNARLTRRRFLFAMLIPPINALRAIFCILNAAYITSTLHPPSFLTSFLPSFPPISHLVPTSPFLCRIGLHSSFHSNNPTQRLDRRHNLLAFLLTHALLEHLGRAL